LPKEERLTYLKFESTQAPTTPNLDNGKRRNTNPGSLMRLVVVKNTD
jgi:hypothetical protein